MSVKTHNNGARRPLTQQIIAPGVMAEVTLTGDVTLDEFSANICKLDPGGASRNVTLPKAADGLMFWFVNAADAAENLVVKNAAAATIGTVNQNEDGIFICVGTTWKLLRIATIALS